MYVGLPILAYDVDFNRKTTKNKVLYFKDTKQLQNNVELLLYDETLCKNIVQNVKRIALERYNWEKIINKYDKIL
jgi:glycosyltransferase involved in cell wall biosynthesis